MKTVKNNILRGMIAEGTCVLALGCFDGVHLGHRQVIETAKDIAQKSGIPLAVLSFDSPPRNAFSPVKTPLIISNAQKSAIFESLGVDYDITVSPTKDFLGIPAEDFVNDIICEKIGARHVVCGFNYSFGAGGKGNSELLEKLCAANGVSVTTVNEYTQNGVCVSSSAIRRAIADGDTETIKNMLGRYYSITADVVNGQHLARKLGFPTVNMIPDSDVLLIKNGVYVTRVLVDAEIRYGITNVGLRPTVNTDILCAETHIFDFDGDLYGKEITVEFLHFLRAETKFESVELLAKQVENDITKAKEYISKITE